MKIRSRATLRMLGVFLALGGLLAARAAPADTPVVYDLGAGPSDVKQLETSSESIELRIDLGTDVGTGTPCVNGTGDHLCAADVLITLDGPGTITGYSLGSGVVYDPDPFVPTTSLRLNVLQSLSPPLPGPQDLGTLTVDASAGTAGSPIRIDASGQAVDAAGSLVTIPTRTIAVPEPSGSLYLVNGILGLALLQRRRTGRAASGALPPPNP